MQRTLAAKDLSNAKIGCVIAGLIKITPMFLIIMPGMIARILFTDEVACVSEEVCEATCGSGIACSNIAYPTLVLRILPAVSDLFGTSYTVNYGQFGLKSKNAFFVM